MKHMNAIGMWSVNHTQNFVLIGKWDRDGILAETEATSFSNLSQKMDKSMIELSKELEM